MSAHLQDDNKDLMGQLANLEEKVSELTAELQSRSLTIELLEKSLDEKQRHVAELESALKVAQESLLSIVWDRIKAYQSQCLAGIEHEWLQQKIHELRQIIAFVENLPASTRHFVETRMIKPGGEIIDASQKQILSVKGQITSYYQKAIDFIISRYRALVEQLNSDSHLMFSEVQYTFDQKIFWPAKNAYDDLSEWLKSAPAEGRSFMEGSVFRPVLNYTDALAIRCHSIQVEVRTILMRSTHQLRAWLREVLNQITRKLETFIDSRSFGSGSDNVSGTYA